MEIQKLLTLYRRHPGVKALAAELSKDSNKTIQLSGLQGSCASLVFASLKSLPPRGEVWWGAPFLFVLDDEEEAGYFYHDLTRLLGDQAPTSVPSSSGSAMQDRKSSEQRC